MVVSPRAGWIHPLVDLLPLSRVAKRRITKAVRLTIKRKSVFVEGAALLQADFPSRRRVSLHVMGRDPYAIPHQVVTALSGSRRERLQDAVRDVANQDILAAPDPAAHARRVVLMAVMAFYPDSDGRLSDFGAFGAWRWNSQGHPAMEALDPNPGGRCYVEGRETVAFTRMLGDGTLRVEPWMQSAVSSLLKGLRAALPIAKESLRRSGVDSDIARAMAPSVKPPASPPVAPQFTEPAQRLVQLREGPRPPNQLWYRGRCFEMQPIPWRLLNHMWGEQRCTEQEVTEAVWGDDSAGDRALGNAIRRANTTLMQAEYPGTLRRKTGYVLFD